MTFKWKMLTAGLILLFGVALQVGLQTALRPYAKNGFYFQSSSSEALMQTVSIIDLCAAPLQTLANIHIQPPGLDALRALFALIWPAPDPAGALLHVDFLLYRGWAVLYGLTGALVFWWVESLSGAKWAFAAALVILLHPASLFYATLLDTTLLTSLLVLLFYLLLWQSRAQSGPPAAAFAAVLLALFFTRSIFQLPFILLAGFALLLRGVAWRKIALIMLIAGGLAGLYTIKQYAQFGLFSTSSFTGLNLQRSIGHNLLGEYETYLGQPAAALPAGLPATLSRETKLKGAVNFNNLRYLAYNRQLTADFVVQLRSTPPLSLARAYLENLSIYLKPSSGYTAHVIVDRLPWRAGFDWFFSAPVLPIWLLGLAGLGLVRQLRRGELMAGLGLALPGLYLILVCVLFERGENNRFKFFLEPVFVVLLIGQLAALAKRLIAENLSKA